MTKKTRPTVAEFCTKNQITMKALRIEERPDRMGDDWENDARHWLCTFKREGFGPSKPMVVYFSQGSAHTKPPTAEEVIDCIASDCDGVQDPFDAWCRNLGYDTDSRKAGRIYNACWTQREKLIRLLGESLADELIYETERL